MVHFKLVQGYKTALNMKKWKIPSAFPGLHHRMKIMEEEFKKLREEIFQEKTLTILTLKTYLMNLSTVSMLHRDIHSLCIERK